MAVRSVKRDSPPWFLIWVPFRRIGVFIGTDEGPDLMNAAGARMGFAASVPERRERRSDDSSTRGPITARRSPSEGCSPRACRRTRRGTSSPSASSTGRAARRPRTSSARSAPRQSPLLTDLLDHEKRARAPAGGPRPLRHRPRGAFPPFPLSRSSRIARLPMDPRGRRGTLWATSLPGVGAAGCGSSGTKSRSFRSP